MRADTRWLVTGASGQLGGHVVAQLAAQTPAPAICALAGTQPVGSDVAVQRVDLADAAAVAACVRAFRPTHVLHFGAITAASDAWANPRQADAVNVAGTAALAEAAAECGAYLLYGSTDMVFAGDAAPYNEEATPGPLNVYGRTKLKGEHAVLQQPRTLVVRLPLLYGFPMTTRLTTFAQQMAALLSGQSVRLFVDEYRTPVWLPDAARAVIGLAEHEATGLLHVAGPERLSRLELIARCATLLGVSNDQLIPTARDELAAPEPRPADLSLDDARFRERFPTLAAGPLTAAAVAPAQIPPLRPTELAARLRSAEPPVLLDCREAREFAVAALPAAVHIPLDDLPVRRAALDPQCPLVVYCHRGVRSLRAAAYLRQVGFTQVAHLRGGIDAWSQEVDATVPRY
jgi:dTDP-4-dehydrorhamnose reductase